jgi:hypothetical protein
MHPQRGVPAMVLFPDEHLKVHWGDEPLPVAQGLPARLSGRWGR